MQVTYNEHELMQLNYDSLIVKARRVLSPWYYRGSDSIGKIEVVNSLVGPSFAYRMAMLLSIPVKYIEEFNKLIQEFLWNGKRAKIPLKILQGNKEQGGLGLIDLRARDVAMKLQWVIKIRTISLLRELADALLGSNCCQKIWFSQLNYFRH